MFVKYVIPALRASKLPCDIWRMRVLRYLGVECSKRPSNELARSCSLRTVRNQNRGLVFRNKEFLRFVFDEHVLRSRHFKRNCREDGGVVIIMAEVPREQASLEEVELGEHKVEEVAGEDIPLGAQSAAVGSDQEVSVPTQQARQPRRVHWRYQSPVSVTNTHTRSRLCRCYQPNRRPVLFLVLLLLGGASLAVLIATIAINATRELPRKMEALEQSLLR
uniref:Uncharacterized protein n=1 Tax=Timema shepardi TaxID=629360 RepID=A0A7R9G7A6_TIMSH|nr:unnamed protein product [Timema shepardi]